MAPSLAIIRQSGNPLGRVRRRCLSRTNPQSAALEPRPKTASSSAQMFSLGGSSIIPRSESDG
eukprot:373537-Alexandrium_andersonii.AAC.1